MTESSASAFSARLHWSGIVSTLLIVSIFTSLSIYANPTDGQVRAGQATISTSGSTLTVTQITDRAIIHWQDFSIPAGSTTKFVQPSATSAALNRVIGGNPSQIYGNLEANGQVYLINPNGVLVGASGVINTAGFIASTLDLPDSDFLAGQDMRFQGDSTASVVNLGKITGSERDVILIARTVENHGTIEAPKGTVALAAGSEVLVKATGDERVFVQAGSSTEASTATQAGLIKAVAAEIKAAGGNEYALAIKHSGVTRATGVTKEGGRIMLSAGKGKVEQSGKLVARTSTKSGGKVRIEADHVELTKKSKIDVSGEGVGNGGEVLIGGGYQGKDASIRNAQTVTAEAGSVIIADGGTEGNGGTVILWSDGTTNFAGDISARGGSVGGNGGFVEVSGKSLGFTGFVNTGGGTLLLDPANITVQTTPGDQDSTWGVGQINSLLATNNVTLQADNNITWAGGALLAYNGPSGRTLTLNAGDDIIFADGGTGVTTGIDATSGGALHVILGANTTNANAWGRIDLTRTTIKTNGGSITLGGGVDGMGYALGRNTGGSANRRGISITGASALDAGGGNIRLSGMGVVSDGVGILVQTSNIRTNGSGTVGLYGVNSVNTGLGLAIGTSGASVTIETGVGAITMDGGEGGISIGSSGSSNIHQIKSDSGNITLVGDKLQVATGKANIQSLGAVAIQPFSDSATIGVGNSATGTLSLTSDALDALQDGFASITIGHENGSGAIDVRGYTFKDNLIIRSPKGNGDITLNGALATGSGAAMGTITLQAGRSIIANSGASITTQSKDITLNSDRDESNGGNIQLTGTTIASNGGSITLGGGANPLTTAAIGVSTASTATKMGVYLTGGGIEAGAGQISMRGKGVGGTSTAHGLYIIGSAKIGSDSSSGSITLNGAGGNSTVTGTSGNYGVVISGSGTKISAASGAIWIIGQGGQSANGGNIGIQVANAARIESTGTATIKLAGTGGIGAQWSSTNSRYEGSNAGLNITGANTLITSVSGDITINGTAGGGLLAAGDGIGGINRGIYMNVGSKITSTGTGVNAAKIALNGTGGSDTAKAAPTDNSPGQNQGLFITGVGTSIESIDGNIRLDGTAAPNGSLGGANYAVFLTGQMTIQSTGNGSIHIIGNGKDGDFSMYQGTPPSRIIGNTGDIIIEANTWAGDGVGSGYIAVDTNLPGATKGSLIIKPRVSTTSIGVAGGTGTLNLSTTRLNFIQDGFSKVIIGHEDGSGAITVNSYTFKDDLIIRAPTGVGDVTLAGSLATGSGAEAGSITLQAGRNILGQSGASITTQGKEIVLNSDRDKGSGTDTGGGRIELIKVTVQSNGGNITLGGGLDPLTQDAVNAATTGGTRGISVNSGSILRSGSGNISMRGSGGTVAGNRGVEVSGTSTIVSSTTGNIALYGTGGSAGTSQEMGVALSSQLKSDTGSITITGTSGGGNSAGILMSGSTIIESGDGATITFNGIGTGTGAGVYVWRDGGTAVTTIGNASRKNVAIVVNSDNLALARESSGTITTEFISSGTITFQPITQGTTIGIGGGSGKLSLAKAQIDTLMAGFSEIIIGNETSGNMTVNASTFTDNLRLVTGGDIAVNGALNVGGNRLALIVGGNTTQGASGNLTAGSLRLGENGNFNLTNANNSVGTLAKSGTGSVMLVNKAALTVDSVDGVDGVTGSTVDLRTSAGNLTLNKSVIATASDNAVVLSTPAGFINNAGATAVQATSGRWLIYSNDPADGTFGSLMSGNNALWNRTITSAAPSSITQMGNRYIFVMQPSLTVTASLVGSKTYGDTYTYPTLAEGTNYHVSGFVNAATYGGVFSQDSAVTIGLTGDPVLSSAGAAASAAKGSYNFAISQGTLANTAGYKFGTFTSGGSLTVNTRAITFVANTATKTYGDADPAVSVRIGSGSLGGTDSLADVTGTITRESGEPVGAYDIQLGSGTKASNYTISYLADNNAFTITPRPIIFVANTVTKTYGDTDPAVSVRIGSGSLTSWDSQGEVTGTITREVGENAGLYDIQIGTGSKASNYTITYLADNNAFRIAPKALTITAHDATRPHLQPNPSFAVSYAGFIPGEGPRNLGGSLSITTPATLSSSPGQYRITPFGLTSGNYAITFVDGALTIFNQTGAELLQTRDMADPENVLMEADNMTDTEGRHLKDWRKIKAGREFRVEYHGIRHYPNEKTSLSSGELLQGSGGEE